MFISFGLDAVILVELVLFDHREVQRRSSSQPLARMLPCSLWVSMNMNTSLSLTSFPMLAAPPTALLPLQRFYQLPYT